MPPPSPLQLQSAGADPMPNGPLREPVKKLDGVLPPVHGRLDGIECSAAVYRLYK